MQRRKLLEIVRERRELLSSKELKGNTYSLIKEDGSFIDYEDKVCFHNLRDNSSRPIFLAYIVRTRVGKGLSTSFTRWWVRDSFAAKAFVTKNEETILEKGAILNGSYPAHYVVLAMIGLRYLWEFPQIIRNWEMFSEHVNNDAAIIMAHMFTYIDKNTWEGDFRSSNSNHTWFQTYWNKDEFTKVVDHDLLALKLLKPMSECTIFSPMIQVFSPKRMAVDDYEKGNLSYPSSSRTEGIKDSFDNYVRRAEVYKEEEMEEWLKKTYSLNYLKKRGNKNES